MHCYPPSRPIFNIWKMKKKRQFNLIPSLGPQEVKNKSKPQNMLIRNRYSSIKKGIYCLSLSLSVCLSICRSVCISLFLLPFFFYQKGLFLPVDLAFMNIHSERPSPWLMAVIYWSGTLGGGRVSNHGGNQRQGGREGCVHPSE